MFYLKLFKNYFILLLMPSNLLYENNFVNNKNDNLTNDNLNKNKNLIELNQKNESGSLI